MDFPASHISFPLSVDWFSFEGNIYFGQGPPEQSGVWLQELNVFNHHLDRLCIAIVCLSKCVCISMLPPIIRRFATTQIHTRVISGLLGADITFSPLLLVNLRCSAAPFYIVSSISSKTCFAARNHMFFVIHMTLDPIKEPNFNSEPWMSSKLIHCMYLDDIEHGDRMKLLSYPSRRLTFSICWLSKTSSLRCAEFVSIAFFNGVSLFP